MYKFLKSQKGKVSAGIAASALASFLFVLAKVEDIETKERITHIMNATTMAEALQQLITGDLVLSSTDENKQTLGPSNTLQIANIPQTNSNLVYTGAGPLVISSSIAKLVSSKYLVQKSDPTAERIKGTATDYDQAKSIAQVTIANGVGTVSTSFLVNLAQDAYTTNTPFTAAEHFFYVQGFDNSETTDSINYATDLLAADSVIVHGSVNMPVKQ